MSTTPGRADTQVGLREEGTEPPKVNSGPWRTAAQPEACCGATLALLPSWVQGLSGALSDKHRAEGIHDGSRMVPRLPRHLFQPALMRRHPYFLHDESESAQGWPEAGPTAAPSTCSQQALQQGLPPRTSDEPEPVSRQGTRLSPRAVCCCTRAACQSGQDSPAPTTRAPCQDKPRRLIQAAHSPGS